MPVPNLVTDLSTVAASNSPVGSDPIGGTLDDYLRNIQAIVKKQFVKGADLASASTLNVPVEGAYFVVTGTTTINAFANCFDGRTVTLSFPAGITLIHSSALVLPGAVNIVTQAGDCGTFVNDGTGIWRCVNYSNGSPWLLSGRNRLINGSFDVAQRWGQGFAAGGPVLATGNEFYPIDRWIVGYGSGAAGSGATALSHFHIKAASGSPGVFECLYYYRMQVLSAFSGASSLYLLQKIENVANFQGKIITVSFNYDCSVASPSLSVSAVQYFGTGGSPSATVTTTSAAQTMSTGSFGRASFTLSVPSIGAKVIGSNGDDWLGIRINLPTATGVNHYFADVQAEIGGVTTPYERRLYAQEMALCQRYYTEVAVTPTSSSVYTYTTLPVAMRVVPTITVKSGSVNGATYAGAPYGTSSIRQTGNSAGASDALLALNAEL